MFENIGNFFKKIFKSNEVAKNASGKEAKERLHLVLMQDRANVSADFLDMMKQEIIEVIKKYIYVDENAIDVRLTNQTNDDGTNGAPALYANIPIINIKENEEENKESDNIESSDKNDTEKDEEKNEINMIEEVEAAEVNEDKEEKDVEKQGKHEETEKIQDNEELEKNSKE